MGNNVTKAQFVDAIAAATNQAKSQIDQTLKAAFDQIEQCLKDGKTITFVGFGTFKRSKRKARTGRNPQTGETIQIPAKNGVKFQPSQNLKDAVNDN